MKARWKWVTHTSTSHTDVIRSYTQTHSYLTRLRRTLNRTLEVSKLVHLIWQLNYSLWCINWHGCFSRSDLNIINIFMIKIVKRCRYKNIPKIYIRLFVFCLSLFLYQSKCLFLFYFQLRIKNALISDDLIVNIISVGSSIIFTLRDWKNR